MPRNQIIDLDLLGREKVAQQRSMDIQKRIKPERLLRELASLNPEEAERYLPQPATKKAKSFRKMRLFPQH